MIIHLTCKVCGKRAEEVSSKLIAGIKFSTLKCGHNMTSVPLSAKDLSLESEDGKKPYPYQIEGARRSIEDGNCRILIADEMGLGKTVQSLMIVKNQKFKFLMIVKSGLRMQWFKETMRWCGMDFLPQIIEGEFDYLLKTKGYIISVDLLYRFKDLEQWIKKLAVDCVIIDECQTIKNHESKRTNCLRIVCKEDRKSTRLNS